jgi:molybdopterin converting factor small subunit
MGIVQLNLPYFLVTMLNKNDSYWLTLERDIKEGATIGDVLADVASRYVDFRRAVFDPDAGKVSDEVLVTLNNDLLHSLDVTEVKVNNGDSITIIPIVSGG